MKPAKIYVGDVLDRSWKTARKPIWIVSAILLLGDLLSSEISNKFLPNDTITKLAESGQITEAFSMLIGHSYLLIIFAIIQTIIIAGICRMVLARSKGDTTYTIVEAYRYSFRDLLRFIAVCLLVSIITAIGYFLLIIPGIIATVYLIFAPYYILEHPEAGITEALRKSYKMVSGNFMPLLSLGIISLLLTIVGYFFFYVPALIAEGYAYFMLADCYRQLELTAWED